MRLIPVLVVLIAIPFGSLAQAKSCEAFGAFSVSPGIPVAWSSRVDGPPMHSIAVTTAADDSPQPARLVLRRDQRFQVIVGFGAALTDSSAYLLEAMPRRVRDQLLDGLFLPAPCGAGLSMLRIPIGSSDFSLRHRTPADRPGLKPDGTLRYFKFDVEERRLLRLLADIRKRQPALAVVLSPWSPPGWMKTTDSMLGGTLRAGAGPAFAQYLSMYVSAMERGGQSVFALTLQNEPGYSPADYPGMLLDASSRAALLAEHVGPLFAARHPGVALLEWDHNWDHPEEPTAVLRDSRARRFVKGVAWHCYGGNVLAQATVAEQFPDMATYLTECSGGTWESTVTDLLTSQTRGLLVGGTRAGASGILLWNLVLDPQGGPHLGGCKGCRPVVTFDATTNRHRYEPEYWALAHFARFLQRGAVRMGMDTARLPEGVEAVAFQNPGGDMAVVLVNTGDEPRKLDIFESSRGISVNLGARSVTSVAW